MPSPPINKRENHCFVSYASEDAELAKKLSDWLTEAGLRVWLDQSRLGAGAPVLDELTTQIRNSRAFLALLTHRSIQKNYVKHESDIASMEQVETGGLFRVIPALVDTGIDPRDRFPALRRFSWIEIPGAELDLAHARRLLLSLTQPVEKVSNTRHVFVSCGWGESEQVLVKKICRRLADLNTRLVGDATDQSSFGEDGKKRVFRIMSGCTGHLMILPARRALGKSREATYKYFLAEREMSRKLGLTRQTLCVERSFLPPVLQEEAIEIGQGEDENQIDRELVALHDGTEPGTPYAFLASDYQYEQERNRSARDIIEHVLGMDCTLGQDYPGEHLREAIVDKIIHSNFVFADLSCRCDPSQNKLQPNVNTCIEAGIALGAGKSILATSLDPKSFDPEVKDKTTQLPFMFRNNQITWYSGRVDYLGKVHRLARAMRRRIINQELKPGIDV